MPITVTFGIISKISKQVECAIKDEESWFFPPQFQCKTVPSINSWPLLYGG